MGDGTLSSTTSILDGSVGQIVVGLLALGIIGILAYKFRHIFGLGR